MSSLDLRLEDSENYPIQAKRLFSILYEYLQLKTTKTTTLQSTAASILTILPKKDPDSTEVWFFGELCIELAEQIPYYHPLQLKLIELLEYLKLSPQLCRIFEDGDLTVGKPIQALGDRTELTILLQHNPTSHFVRYSRLGGSIRDNLNGSSIDSPPPNL